MKRHSLLFGVQNYPGEGSLTPLTGAHADVDALANVFSDPRYVGDAGQVVVVKDPTHTEARAHFRTFLNGVSRDDVALIHFSGHGVRDDSGDLFLCFSDAEEHELEFTALNVARLGEWLEKKRLRRTLITLDCCYSGAAGAQLSRDSLASKISAVERHLPDGTGLYVLSSAGTTETAKEGDGRGIFTHHLIQGIVTGAADKDGDGNITVAEIAEYLQIQVPKDAAKQTPHLTAHKVAGTFTIAHNPIALEAKSAKAAAEAAAKRAEQREKLIASAVEKLKEHVAFGSISLAFAGNVQSWLLHHEGDGEAHPRLRLLRQFGDGRITAVEFHSRWNATPAEEPEDEPAAAGPSSIPPQPPPAKPTPVQPQVQEAAAATWQPEPRPRQQARTPAPEPAPAESKRGVGARLSNLRAPLLFVVGGALAFGLTYESAKDSLRWWSSTSNRFLYDGPPFLTAVIVVMAGLGLASALLAPTGPLRRSLQHWAMAMGAIAAVSLGALEGGPPEADAAALGTGAPVALVFAAIVGLVVFFAVRWPTALIARSAFGGGDRTAPSPDRGKPSQSAPAAATAGRLKNLVPAAVFFVVAMVVYAMSEEAAICVLLAGAAYGIVTALLAPKAAIFPLGAAAFRALAAFAAFVFLGPAFGEPSEFAYLVSYETQIIALWLALAGGAAYGGIWLGRQLTGRL